MNFAFLLIFFVYGLAFFSMGLVTILEAFRTPGLRQARVLIPLGVFGLVHGMHEWVEMILVLLSEVAVIVPSYWNFIRIGFLVFSFATLIGYGMQVFSSRDDRGNQDLVIGTVMVVIYGFSLLAIGAVPSLRTSDWVGPAQIMARYLLATPGALLTSMALHQQSSEMGAMGRDKVSNFLQWASIGFGLYGVTQFLGPIISLVGEQYLLSARGFVNQYPILVTRAILATIITWSLIRMTQALEEEKRLTLEKAQKDRLDALESLNQEITNRNQMRKDLLRRTVELQEEERSRVSRELHDEAAQLLTGFNANLAALKLQLQPEESIKRLVDRLDSLTSQMSVSIRKLVRDLRPAQLDELGIHAAIENLIDFGTENLGLEIKFEYNKICERLDPLLETVIYRVVQEALTNIAKYSEVKLAVVRLRAENGEIAVLIEDKGVGFDSEQKLKSGFGLMGLEERTRSMGGKFEVISSPGKGSIVQAIFPLDKPCSEENVNG